MQVYYKSTDDNRFRQLFLLVQLKGTYRDNFITSYDIVLPSHSNSRSPTIFLRPFFSYRRIKGLLYSLHFRVVGAALKHAFRSVPSLSNDVINWPKKKKEHSPTGVEFFGRELEELRVGLGRGECQEGGKKERERKEGGLPAGVCVQRQLGDRWNKLGAFSSSRLLVWLVGAAAAGAFECYNQPSPMMITISFWRKSRPSCCCLFHWTRRSHY